VSADTGDDATTFAHTSQTLSDARSYRVRAKNSAGDGAWSTVFNTGTATAPGAPTSVTVTRRGSSALQVRWSAPASNGGSAVTGYRVQRSADGSDPWTDIYTGTDLRYNDNNLGRGITRHYRVYAKNTVGEGPASTSAMGTTRPAAVPTEPLRDNASSEVGRTVIQLL